MHACTSIMKYKFGPLNICSDKKKLYIHQPVKMTIKGFFVFQNICDFVVNDYKFKVVLYSELNRLNYGKLN